MQEKNSQFSILVLERLKSLLGIRKDKDLVQMLEVKQNTYSTWKARNTLDYDKIIAFCESRNIDLNYIFYSNAYKTSIVSEPNLTYGSKNKDLTLESLNNRVSEMECILQAIRLKFEVDSEIEETINSLKKKNLAKKS